MAKPPTRRTYREQPTFIESNSHPVSLFALLYGLVEALAEGKVRLPLGASDKIFDLECTGSGGFTGGGSWRCSGGCRGGGSGGRGAGSTRHHGGDSGSDHVADSGSYCDSTGCGGHLKLKVELDLLKVYHFIRD